MRRLGRGVDTRDHGWSVPPTLLTSLLQSCRGSCPGLYVSSIGSYRDKGETRSDGRRLETGGSLEYHTQNLLTGSALQIKILSSTLSVGV